MDETAEKIFFDTITSHLEKIANHSSYSESDEQPLAGVLTSHVASALGSSPSTPAPSTFEDALVHVQGLLDSVPPQDLEPLADSAALALTESFVNLAFVATEGSVDAAGYDDTLDWNLNCLNAQRQAAIDEASQKKMFAVLDQLAVLKAEPKAVASAEQLDEYIKVVSEAMAMIASEPLEEPFKSFERAWILSLVVPQTWPVTYTASQVLDGYETELRSWCAVPITTLGTTTEWRARVMAAVDLARALVAVDQYAETDPNKAQGIANHMEAGFDADGVPGGVVYTYLKELDSTILLPYAGKIGTKAVGKHLYSTVVSETAPTTPRDVTSLKATISGPDKVYPGQPFTLTAKVTDAEGVEVTDVTYLWDVASKPSLGFDDRSLDRTGSSLSVPPTPDLGRPEELVFTLAVTSSGKIAAALKQVTVAAPVELPPPTTGTPSPDPLPYPVVISHTSPGTQDPTPTTALVVGGVILGSLAVILLTRQKHEVF